MSRQVTRELELKFLVPTTFDLPELAGKSGPAAASTDETLMTLVAVYYDTVDLRLARQGITLRRRSGGGDDGWHLKLPSTGAVHDRLEIASTSRAEAIPKELTELVTVYRRLSELAPAATLITERRSRTLLDGDGNALAEVVDDWVSVESADRVPAPFREVEVEDRGGGEEFLAAISRRLATVGAGPADFLPKAVRALGPRAVSPAEPAAPEPVKKRSPARLVVESHLRSEIRLAMSLEPRARLGDLAALDALHDALVRLRTGLRLLRPLLEPTWVEEVRGELGWLTGELAPNDAFTAAHRLAASGAAVPDVLALGTSRTLLTKRRDEQDRLREARAIAALRDRRWPAVLDRLVIACATPPTTRPALRTCRDVLPDLVAHSWSDLLTRGESLDRPAPKETDCRKTLASARRLRLALALSAPVLGKPGRRSTRTLVRLQVALEDRAATQLTCASALQLANATRVGAGAFTLGVLFEREQMAMRVGARECRKAWQGVVAEHSGSRFSTR